MATLIKRRVFRFQQLAALLLSTIALSTPAAALTDKVHTPNPPPPSDQPEPIDFYQLFPELLDQVDTRRNYLSDKFVTFANGIDRFFGNERDFQESNKSVLQVDLTRVSGYNGDHNFILSARAKLSLPNTERRLHLLVETDPEQNVTGN